MKTLTIPHARNMPAFDKFSAATSKTWLMLIAAALAAAIPVELQAQTAPMENLNLFERIGQDMSRFPFDMTEDEARKLDLEDVTYTEEDFGLLIDENGTHHYFYEGLYGKTLTIAPSGPSQNIQTIGIGHARSKDDVLAAFYNYSGGQTLTCDTVIIDNENSHVQEHKNRFCQFVFDYNFDALLSLKFDKNKNLIEIYLQAWKPF